jgi:hypothetical protein
MNKMLVTYIEFCHSTIRLEGVNKTTTNFSQDTITHDETEKFDPRKLIKVAATTEYINRL